MKSVVLVFASLAVNIAYSADINPSIQKYWSIAEQQNLDQDITWQRLMYANKNHKSDVTYSGYFMSENGKNNLKEELKADISALFIPAQDNQSIRCKFPARSQWLMQKIGIQENELPQIKCSEFENWIGQIKPYKATLIYATDFMGNPSSMFGHTLLRLDPKDQQQLNLVSYAVNYAATVAGNDNWSYAWKGLTGQYPGEYSLMPYYRKVKEYGDFESRDLWEYELKLSPEETRFLVSHIWEMQHVSFPYYFVSDNCAYRLLGLVDLVKPESNLQEKFTYASIPMETIKSMQQQGLTKAPVYRPALETQLLAQAHQHGASLAKVAHQITMMPIKQSSELLKSFSEQDQAKILEMAYDDLYLQFTSRQIEESVAQPQLRQLLALRSQIDLDKQRQEPKRPEKEPTQGHNARNLSLKAGEVQGDKFIEIGHRQAYHDLIDPQGGYRAGTQLLFLNGNAQWRDDHLKLEHLDLLEVNSYNPIQPFKTPLSWGFNLGWRQEAIHDGNFSEEKQHGVANFNAQFGYSLADYERKHICYGQLQTYVQTGSNLDKGWRVGMGPTLGCMNQWFDRFNSVVQIELPYWEDQNQWNLRVNTQWQYVINRNNAVRLNWDYEQQNHQDWMKSSLGYVWFF
ncbi:Lnb N-terminal periplasmic domain-containing protein [Acinetobacter sp. 1124_18A]|uniref:Lnb N-terminal periplasmic domain-containing protein n=1 Tax=Acinetobacter sp. 1124_18A TaxID=2605958 RepID=UPI0040586D8A